MSWKHRTTSKLSSSSNRSNLASSQSSSSILITPIVSIPTSTIDTKLSIFSPIERRLAKYRSLPFLWLRACGSNKRRNKDSSLAAIVTIMRDVENTLSEDEIFLTMFIYYLRRHDYTVASF
ncbi:unnamed protein product [Didymodactylos carnosus]|uniref:Uncharacterized protein n=1 Tax=Didymodactylos carnosus TaxID=1234261 RepID=A0A813W4F0_9BILA|nr:unnamed protein product [Didymodactylos carnosus]CAF3638329.1 unnamed protein product [Didymodactylos carnosus]